MTMTAAAVMTAVAPLYDTQASYKASIVSSVEASIRAAHEKFTTGEKAFARDYGIAYGKVLYEARQKLNDAGYGQLSSLLDNLNIPRSTAYLWMEKYEISVGIKEAKPVKKEEPVAAAIADIVPDEPVSLDALVATLPEAITLPNRPEIWDIAKKIIEVGFKTVSNQNARTPQISEQILAAARNTALSALTVFRFSLEEKNGNNGNSRSG
jgi:hypothetical protein